MKCSVLFFLSLFAASSLCAQPTSWTSRGVGGGGALFLPSINPNNNDEVYLACDMSQVFRSTNFGGSWRVVPFRQLQATGHVGRVEFTNDPSVRYTIDWEGEAPHPVKSTDGGATWTDIGDPTGGEVYDLYADFDNPGRILITSYSTLYISTDGGTNFSVADELNDDAGYYIAGVLFDGDRIVIGTPFGIRISTNGGQSFSPISVGGIPSDEAIISFTGAREANTVRLFCVTLGSADVYNGATAVGNQNYRDMYTLDLGQNTWTSLGDLLPSGALPYFVAMAQNNVDVAYAAGGSDENIPTVFKTTDGGTTWESVLECAGNVNITTGWSGAGGDRDWWYGEYALGFTVARNNADRAIITDFGFAHSSSDGGATWRQMYVDKSTENLPAALTPKGKSYRSIGLENTSCWHLLWADAQTVVGSYSDIRGTRSEDGGLSWSFGYTGHTDNSMYRAVAHPTSGIIYAATATVHDMYQSTYLADNRIDNGGGKVLYSADKGTTWQTLHDFGHPVVWVALDPQHPSRLYASVAHSSQGGIYMCDDIQLGSSSTWTKLTLPPRAEGHPSNIHVLDDGTLVCTYSGRRAGTPVAFTASSGVFTSQNNGQSWTDVSDPGMHYWTKDMMIDPRDGQQNTWLVAVFSGWGGAPNGKGGLYRTTNRGQSWTKISDLDRVTSGTFPPGKPNEFYLTTETEGLWYSSNMNAAMPEFQQVESFPFRQPERVFFNPYKPEEIWVTSFGGGIFVGAEVPSSAEEISPGVESNSLVVAPNPASQHITLRYTLASAGRVTATLRDITGRTVAQLFDKEQAAGDHILPVDISLPTGVYLCAVNSGGTTHTQFLIVTR